jgi:hypothetical protein
MMLNFLWLGSTTKVNNISNDKTTWLPLENASEPVYFEN